MSARTAHRWLPRTSRRIPAARRPFLGVRIEGLEDRTVPSAAFDITGLTALRADPAFADVDGALPGQSRNIGIAVLDTGVFGNHPALRGNLKAYYDAVSNATINGPVLTDPAQVTPAADPGGHGSHVAGTAASTDPRIGVATKADLIGVRVLLGPNDRNVRHDPLVTGLNWVAANQQKYNIRVVNLSLGSGGNFNDVNQIQATQDRVAEAQAIRRLENLGVTVVTASGNSYAEFGKAGAAFPAAISTISVANTWEDNGAGDEFPFGRGGQRDRFFAVDRDGKADRLAGSSQRSGLPNQVAAPGTSIFSTWNGAPDKSGRPKLYSTIDGTSMASPFVAGVAALMQDAAFTASGRYLAPADVLRILRDTADVITDAPTDRNFKFDGTTKQALDLPETGLQFRRVNAQKAVQAARGQVGGGKAGTDANNIREAAVTVPSLDGNRIFTFRGAIGTDGQTAVGANDVDLFKVVAKSPGTLLAATIQPDGGKGFDSYVRIFTATGAEIAANDDFGSTPYGAAGVSVQPGTYYVGVSSFNNATYDITTGAGAANGGSQGDYLLGIQLNNADPNGVFTGAVDYPHDDGILPIFDPSFTLFDDPGSGLSGKVGYLVTGRIFSDPPPADSPPDTPRVTIGPGDVDMFRYVVPDDGRLFVRVASFGPLVNPFGAPLGSGEFAPFDTYLRVFDANGNQIASDDDSGPSTDSELLLTGLQRGQVVYLAVSNFANADYDQRNPEGRPNSGTGGYYELFGVFDNGDLNGTAFSAVELPSIGTQAGGTIGTDFLGPTIGRDGSLDVDFLRVTAPSDGVLRVTATGAAGFQPSVSVWGFQFDAGKNVTGFDKIATTNQNKSVVMARVQAGQTYYVSFTGQGNAGFHWYDVASGSGGQTGDYTVQTELLPLDGGKTVQDKGVRGGAPPRLLTLGAAVEGDTGSDFADDGTEYVVETLDAGGIRYGQGDIDTYTFVAPATGRVAFRAYARGTLGGASDPVLRVFDVNGTELGFNDDVSDSTRDAEVVLDVVAGQTYHVGITGYSDKAADYEILTGTGLAAQAGGVVGPYTVEVVDLTPPTVTDIPDQPAVAAGQAIGPIPFAVGDLGTPPDQLAIAVASSDPALVPVANIAVGGSGPNRTLTITPAPGRAGTATITVVVTDADGRQAVDTFVVTVNPPPNTPPTISDVPDQAVAAGGTVGPIPFAVGDGQTPADQLAVTVTSSNPGLVPAANVVIGGSGASRTITVTPAAGQTGTATVTVTVTDAAGATVSDSFVVTVTPALPPPPPPGPSRVLVGFPQFAAGADVGGTQATLYNPDKSVRYATSPFGGFTGGVRTAAADFNRDGVADLVVGTGPGGPTRVLVLDGKTQAVLFAVDPFEASFTGGVYVAAGDLTGDGVPDLVITPDEGGGPRCDVYSGAGFGKLASFFGIDDPNFRGGARAAVADVNGDRVGDLIVAAGFGGGPRVAGFDGKSVAAGAPARIFGDFFMFEQTLRNGVFITAGDLDGDGFADVIAGGGPGGGPRVFALSGKGLVGGNQQIQLANFFGGNPDSRGGIRVGVKDLDEDTRADIVVGAGAGAGSRVTAYLGRTVAPDGVPPAFADYDAFPGFAGGVFVG